MSGLGTVQALNTVPIHSQIDGKLIEITFTEGQHVKKGDVLARIDPRLFQAALDQAKAKKGQDEANLISAEKDLTRAKTLVARSFETQQTVDQQQAKVDALKASIAADEAAIETAQDPARLHHDHGADRWPRRHPPGRCRQHRPRQRLDSTRHPDPDPAVGGDLHAAGNAARAAARRHGARPGRGDGARPEQRQGRLAPGKLLLIDDLIDQATATIRLKALFPNTDERLWPGEFVNARVLLETRRQRRSRSHRPPCSAARKACSPG